ncbi:hypothetical protein FQZ97_1016420 [compost metagenome]
MFFFQQHARLQSYGKIVEISRLGTLGTDISRYITILWYVHRFCYICTDTAPVARAIGLPDTAVLRYQLHLLIEEEVTQVSLWLIRVCSRVLQGVIGLLQATAVQHLCCPVAGYGAFRTTQLSGGLCQTIDYLFKAASAHIAAAGFGTFIIVIGIQAQLITGHYF